MKYTIHMNQKVIAERFPSLDLVDAAILSFIEGFLASPAIMTIQTGGKTYFWFNHRYIADEMPLIGIKTPDGIYRRLIKLAEAGLLQPHPDNKATKRSFYGTGPRWMELITSDGDPADIGQPSEVTSDGKPMYSSIKGSSPLNQERPPLSPKGEECVKDLFGDIPTGPPEETPPQKQATIKELSDAIWDNYPKGIGKQRSSPQKVFGAMSKVPASDRPSVEIIVVALDAWKKSWAWTKENGDLVMGAARWVNERQWENIPEPAKPRANQPYAEKSYADKFYANENDQKIKLKVLNP